MSDLEQELIKAFRHDAGSMIYTWADQQGLRLGLGRPLTNGKSGAPVRIVTEYPRRGVPKKRLVKVCQADDGDSPREAARHIAATIETPTFAEKHLVALVHFLPVVSSGEIIMIQEIAGSRVGDAVPLAHLLASIAEDPTDGLCSAEDFADGCKHVVRSTLRDWKLERDTDMPIQPVGVATLLHELLQGRLGPRGTLRRWASDHAPGLLDMSNRWICLDGEVLPNPVVLALDTAFCLDRTVEPLKGPAHGDLHEENILVCVEDIRAGRGRRGKQLPYWLIDLSRYSSYTLLAYDPAHLLLSIAGRHLDQMPDGQRAALIRFLVDPSDGNVNGSRIPGWLKLVVTSIRDAPPQWLDRFRLEWREQTLLSMVAGGLVFAARQTTSEELRGWYLRVAAHAANAFVAADETQLYEPRPAAVDATPIILGTAAPGLLPKPPLPAPNGQSPTPSRAKPVEPEPPLDTSSVAVAENEPGDTSTERLDDGPVWHPSRPPSDLSFLPLADKLADRVGRQWSLASHGRRLDRPKPIPISWARTKLPVVGPPSDAIGKSPGFEGSTTLPGPGADADLSHGEIHDLFGEVYCRLRPGRLVILGDEGRGKSAAAIGLLLRILAYRAGLPDDERARVAVPVILTPHDWDPEKEKLRTWVTRRLMADYPQLLTGHRDDKAIERLVKEGHVALFLDGLDDVAEHARSVGLKVLDERCGLRIVLLSRLAQMVAAAAEARLYGAVAVELQPVAPEAAADYLVRCQVEPVPPRWQRLIDHVRRVPDSPVTQALDSPLMLSLVRDNYERDDEVDELLESAQFSTKPEVEQHLLKGVLPAAYRQLPAQARPRYGMQKAQRYLGFLAHRMKQDQTCELAWWHLPRFVPRPLWWLASAVATGLLPGVLFGGLGWLTQRPGLGFVLGMAFGPAAVAFDAAVVHDRQRGGPATRLRIAGGYLLINGVAGGLAGALVAGVERGAVPGLATGGGVGLVGALIVWDVARRLGVSSRPAAASDGPPKPKGYWHQDGRHSVIFGAVLGLMVGVTLALACVFVNEEPTDAAGAAVLGALSMFFFAIVLSLRAKAMLAALLLWVLRRAPFRLIPFLEDARDRNVLRSAGPVYQFRHARLQDVLAARYEATRRRRRWRRRS